MRNLLIALSITGFAAVLSAEVLELNAETNNHNGNKGSTRASSPANPADKLTKLEIECYEAKKLIESFSHQEQLSLAEKERTKIIETLKTNYSLAFKHLKESDKYPTLRALLTRHKEESKEMEWKVKNQTDLYSVNQLKDTLRSRQVEELSALIASDKQLHRALQYFFRILTVGVDAKVITSSGFESISSYVSNYSDTTTMLANQIAINGSFLSEQKYFEHRSHDGVLTPSKEQAVHTRYFIHVTFDLSNQNNEAIHFAGSKIFFNEPTGTSEMTTVKVYKPFMPAYCAALGIK